MVDLDLRKLSAPVEALRPELAQAYKRLDEQWEEIVSCLKKLAIPCSVSYLYDSDPSCPEDGSFLVWKKWNGKKRICVEVHTFVQHNPFTDYEVTTTPYDQWSGEMRVEMLKHVPALFEAVEKQTKAFIEKTKN